MLKHTIPNDSKEENQILPEFASKLQLTVGKTRQEIPSKYENYRVTDISLEDFRSGEIVKFDKKCFGKDAWPDYFWERQIENAIIKKKIYNTDQLTPPIIGGMMVNLRSNSFYISTISIIEGHRRLGLASYLIFLLSDEIQKLQSDNKHLGIKYVSLDVDKENTKAQQLYQKLGFGFYAQSDTQFRMAQSIPNLIENLRSYNLNIIESSQKRSKVKPIIFSPIESSEPLVIKNEESDLAPREKSYSACQII